MQAERCPAASGPPVLGCRSARSKAGFVCLLWFVVVVVVADADAVSGVVNSFPCRRWQAGHVCYLGLLL